MGINKKQFKKLAYITALTGVVLASALALSGCGSNNSASKSSSSSDTVVIGTTDKIVTIDPAGSYENGSFLVETNVYPFLYNFAYGSTTPEPDVADGAGEFSADGTEYTV